MGKLNQFVDLSLLKALIFAKYHDELAMNEDQFNSFLKAMSQRSGLIILSGVTSSGMNTHIYTALLALARKRKKVSSVEIAQRCNLPGVDQTTVDGFDKMAMELDRLASTDTQIIYLREITTCDDLEAALRAVECGKLVLTTIHAPDVVSVFNRLFNISLISGNKLDVLSSILDSVLLIQTQRKLPKLCDNCKSPMDIEDNLLGLLEMEDSVSDTFYNPRVCEYCSDEKFSGYRGYSYIYESLYFDDANKEKIKFYFDVGKPEAWSRPPFNYAANQLLSDSAKERASQGVISIGDCFRGSEPGKYLVDDYPVGFLEYMLRVPLNKLSAKVFSLNIHEFINYPRIVIETHLGDSGKDLKEVIISKDGYFIVNSCSSSDVDSVKTFKTCRGRVSQYESEAWFMEYEDTRETKPCVDAHQYYYDLASDETGDVNFTDIKIAKTLNHPQANMIFEPGVRSFDMPEGDDSGLAVEALAEKILKEFEQMSSNSVLNCAEQLLPSEVVAAWSNNICRSVNRVASLSLKKFNSKFDDEEGYFCLYGIPGTPPR